MVDDDLPSVVGVLEDQGEKAFGTAAVFFCTFEAVFAEDDCEVFVEGMDLEVGVGEGSHGGSARIITLVLFDKTGKATEDLMGDKESVRRVFEALYKSCEVAVVPCVFLSDEDLDDVEFLPGGGMQWVGLLSREKDGCEQRETKSD